MQEGGVQTYIAIDYYFSLNKPWGTEPRTQAPTRLQSNAHSCLFFFLWLTPGSFFKTASVTVERTPYFSYNPLLMQCCFK